MASGIYSRSFSVGSKSIGRSISRTGDNSKAWEISLAAAQAGSLTTRSTDTSGTITMTSGSHTITTAMVVDVYWAGGVQYGCTVGTVVGSDVPISGGSGDVLPIATTALTVCEQVTAKMAIDGDNIQMIGVESFDSDASSITDAAHIQFRDSASAEIAEIDLVANAMQIWDIAGGDSNIFTGNDIATAKLSNGGTTAKTIKVLSLEDSTA